MFFHTTSPTASLSEAADRTGRPARLFAASVLASLLCAALLCLAPCAQADPAPAAQKVVRVAYVEGGPFVDYQLILRGIAVGLQRCGLIENGEVPVPEKQESSAPMWAWLGQYAGGAKIEFVQDAFYSAGWDMAARMQIREDVLRRLRDRKDIDMLLAFGTWAGQDFSRSALSIPVVVSSVTNAMESGIVLGIARSGLDNVVASIEPDRYKQQVMLFHSIFGFKKLGIAYEDTMSGRSSISLNEIEAAARDLKIDLVRCTDTFDIADTALAADRLEACHRKLAAQGADAVYVTLNIGLQPDTTARVLEPLTSARIPTFSQTGQVDVKHGALLSISQLNTEEEGAFTAKQIEAVIKGAKPGSLNQKFESVISFAMNLRTAARIGWNPSLEILTAVDQFYQEDK